MTTPSILSLRRHIAEQYIEQLIALLDQLDEDPDLEEDDPPEWNGDEQDQNGDEGDFLGVIFIGGSAP